MDIFLCCGFSQISLTPRSALGEPSPSLWLRRRFLLRDKIETASGKIHEFTPPLEGFKPGEVLEKELSFLSACSRVCLKAFLNNLITPRG